MEAVHGAEEPGGALGALGVQEDTRHVSKRMYEIASYHVRNEAWWQVPVARDLFRNRNRGLFARVSLSWLLG
jgi:hypothetical protein